VKTRPPPGHGCCPPQNRTRRRQHLGPRRLRGFTIDCGRASPLAPDLLQGSRTPKQGCLLSSPGKRSSARAWPSRLQFKNRPPAARTFSHPALQLPMFSACLSKVKVIASCGRSLRIQLPECRSANLRSPSIRWALGPVHGLLTHRPRDGVSDMKCGRCQ
jgi:hypothetical protein